MIKSMTGFAASVHEDEHATVAVTIRSVNHRYLDLQVRLPPVLAELEPRVRAQLQRRITRGRVEATIGVQFRQSPAVEIELNEEIVAALSATLEAARARGVIAGTLTPGDLLRVPQAVTIRERSAHGSAEVGRVGGPIEATIEEALADLDRMRGSEGEYLRDDLENRRVIVLDLVGRIARAADEGRVAAEARLADRVRELVGDLQADRAAIAQEIVRAAARSDISEELARFRAHLAHWAALTDAPEPCGRKLDFLLQEMHREVNTMGAKADGVLAVDLIITVKAELEKMREQVQNVE